MGVKHMWDILESCKKTLPLHHLQNKRVCIDLSCWMVQFQNVNKSYPSMKDKVYLRSLFHRLRALIALNCSLIFVTDGSVPAIKLSTYRRRLNAGCEVVRNETVVNKVTSLRRNKGSEFSCMIKEAKDLGIALGIPCLDSIEEGEAQCALLDSEGLCDGCFSSDSDAFLFGARTVYRDICLGDGGYVVCYEMADIERKLGFGRNSLIALALLLGSDYSRGVYGLGPESACQIVKSTGDDTILKRIVSEGLSFAKKPKASSKQGQVFNCKFKENYSDHAIHNGNEQDLQSNNTFLQVMHAYMKPRCHLADSDAVRRVLIPYPFQLSNLQQICAQFFEWPPEITDEYILPKISERDLRRFANLRATSSNLGVLLPLDKIPVQCPISTIIKRRKVKGKDCFEVSWVDVDGLQSSVVPADLIKSACPEKIVQFEERLAEKKQNHRKPRSKKSENQASMAEIDKRLQHMLLDIDSENDPLSSAFACQAKPSENVTSAMAIDLARQEPFLVTVPESGIGCIERIQPSNGSQLEKVIIDLLSPSPPAPVRKLSKYPPVTGANIDVIDLCELETDASPEHQRKARELRLFLASIKEDIR